VLGEITVIEAPAKWNYSQWYWD